MPTAVTLDIGGAGKLPQVPKTQAKEIGINDALATLQNWRNSSNDELKKALQVIDSTGTTAQKAGSKLVDLISSYNGNSEITQLAIQVAVFLSPDTPGLKEALLNAFNNARSNAKSLRLEIVQAFKIVKIDGDKDVINMLASILLNRGSYKELSIESSMESEARKLLIREKGDASKTLDEFLHPGRRYGYAPGVNYSRKWQAPRSNRMQDEDK